MTGARDLAHLARVFAPTQPHARLEIRTARALGDIEEARVVGLTGAYASEWSLMSMYLLFIAVVTFRSRGLFGKKSVLDV